MDDRTLQFLIFSAVNVASVFAGHQARVHGLVKETASRKIHFCTFVFVWSTVALFALWRLPPRAENAWLLLIEPVLVAGPAFAMILLGRLLGLRRAAIGVLAIGAGLGNLGFTLGAYLCYVLLPLSMPLPPAPGGPD